MGIAEFSRTRRAGWFFLCAALAARLPAAQDPASSITQFFEGKQVVVRLDMPGTQQGVDIYPERPQPLDTKSYASRLKKFGTSLRNGDTVTVTKVKVKDNGIEFQLGGGGYGTAMDDTDTSTHFTPADKSGREKNLEDELRNESDPDKRRALKRELDDARDARQRRDQRDRSRAEEAADGKRQMVDARRAQGGSRFNIRLDTRTAAVTPDRIMAALSSYVTFPAEMSGGATETARLEPAPGSGPPPPVSPSSDPLASLKKGLTREQVESLFGKPLEAQDLDQNGLKLTKCKYQTAASDIRADFVNGVLVQYTVSSR